MHVEYPEWLLTMAIAWIVTGDLTEVSRWAVSSPEMSHAVQVADDNDGSSGWHKLRKALAEGEIEAVASRNGQTLAPVSRLDWSLGSGSYDSDLSLTWHNRTGDSFREIHVAARDLQRIFPGGAKRTALRLVTSGSTPSENEHIELGSKIDASSDKDDEASSMSDASKPIEETAFTHATAKRRGRGRRLGSGVIDDASALDAIRSRANGHEDQWWRECGDEAQKIEPKATAERISSIQKRLYRKLTQAKAANSPDELR